MPRHAPRKVRQGLAAALTEVGTAEAQESVIDVDRVRSEASILLRGWARSYTELIDSALAYRYRNVPFLPWQTVRSEELPNDDAVSAQRPFRYCRSQPTCCRSEENQNVLGDGA